MKQNNLTHDNQLALRVVQKNGMITKYIYTPNKQNDDVEEKRVTSFMFIRTARKQKPLTA